MMRISSLDGVVMGCGWVREDSGVVVFEQGAPTAEKHGLPGALAEKQGLVGLELLQGLFGLVDVEDGRDGVVGAADRLVLVV
jgi:hypothetical protein